MHWSQFHRCTKLYKRKQEERKFVCKLDVDNIKSVGDFFQTDDTSFPLPDKKYSGQCFLKHRVAKSILQHVDKYEEKNS